VIDRASALDTSQDLALYSVQYIFRMILLAAFSILKITRSDAGGHHHHIDIEGGERSYFAAIPFAKKRSLQNGDVDAKCALILTQLWSSKNIFKRKDGTYDSLRLRTRSRLVIK
jgi:transcriptional regulatory protein LEU3